MHCGSNVKDWQRCRCHSKSTNAMQEPRERAEDKKGKGDLARRESPHQGHTGSCMTSRIKSGIVGWYDCVPIGVSPQEMYVNSTHFDAVNDAILFVNARMQLLVCVPCAHHLLVPCVTVGVRCECARH
eukprot:6206922-Pleurochrysis_carterae.AAC.2